MSSWLKHVVLHAGPEATNALFNAIQNVIMRALLAVQPVMINDKHSFEVRCMLPRHSWVPAAPWHVPQLFKCGLHRACGPASQHTVRSMIDV